MGMATGIIADFLSGSTRIGIRDGGMDGDIMITDTHIIHTTAIPITGTTIPITTTRTAPTTRAIRGRRASQLLSKADWLGAVTTLAKLMVSSDRRRGARSASFSGTTDCQ